MRITNSNIFAIKQICKLGDENVEKPLCILYIVSVINRRINGRPIVSKFCRLENILLRMKIILLDMSLGVNLNLLIYFILLNYSKIQVFTFLLNARRRKAVKTTLPLVNSPYSYKNML